MSGKFFRLAQYTLIVFFVLFFSAGCGRPLQPWHTYVPAELTAREMNTATWKEYTDRENKIFDDIYHEVVLKTPASEKTSINRYFEGSQVYPPHFKEDWNRSYRLIPDKPKGAVVLLHGLTDTPYSMRYIARLYYERGFVAVGLRLPGHGTVPGALTEITWQDMMAATRLAVREAKRLSPQGTPLHLVGFSQGGALAVKYALDALEDDSLPRPDRLILISPMIGITRLAKLAEVMAIPSFIPGFERAAWLSIMPEFNPFKYNSFPANAVRQARLLIAEMRRQTARLYENGRIKELPPIITFQSIIDYTVSTPALINNLYSNLSYNGSELVLFDINRDTAFTPLVRPVFLNMMSNMLPDLPQRYKITLIGNAAVGDSTAVERTALPGDTEFTVRPLGLTYPSDVFSLSHISLPFPQSDPLYGSAPDAKTKDDFGLNLGLVANAQGERGILKINTNLFFRISSNPLFSYLMQRIDDIISGYTVPRAKAGGQYDVTKTKSKMTPEEYNAIIKESDYGGTPF